MNQASTPCRSEFCSVGLVPLAMDHQGNVMYVRNAFSGTDWARRVSFQKWKVCVKPRIVHNGL